MKWPCAICLKKKEPIKEIAVMTGVCYECYLAGMELPSDEWCFGEYDREDEACQTHCLDRNICRKVTTNLVTLKPALG